MIARDLRVEDIDPRHYANLIQLLDPPEGLDPAPEGGAAFGLFDRLTGATQPAAGDARDLEPNETTPGWTPAPCVALMRGREVVRLARLGGGTLAPRSLKSADPQELRRFRREHRLPFIAAVDVKALPRIWADVNNAVHVDDDLVAQQLAVVKVLQRAVADELIVVEPELIGSLPIPPFPVVQATFDRMLPDNRSFVFYVVDRRRIWTSLIAVKREGDIQQITSHRAIAGRVRWSSIHASARHVVEAVGELYQPVHIGIFLPLSSWHRLVWGDRSAVARAVSSRQAVLDPCPAWLLALVGVGAVSEAASSSVRFAGRLLSRSGLLPGPAGRLLNNVSSPLEALGVDPWEAITWGRKWSRRVLPLLRSE